MNTLIYAWWALRDVYPHLQLFGIGVLQSTCVVAAAWLLALALRGQSAVARSWTWRVGFVCLLGAGLWLWSPHLLEHLRPVLTVQRSEEGVRKSADVLEKAGLLLPVSEPAPLLENQPVMMPKADTAAAAPAKNEPAQQAAPLTVRPVSLWVWAERGVLLAWWSGAVAMAGWKLLRMFLGARWLRRVSEPAPPDLMQMAEAVVQAEGRKVFLTCHLAGDIASPLLTGWCRPTVWLPWDSATWSAAKLRLVLRHELAHFRRQDGTWQVFATLVACFWWWHPGAWLALCRLQSEAEMAADELVVGQTAGAPDYAETLVQIARAGAKDPLPATGVPMLGKSLVEKRVRAILEENPWRGHLSLRARGAILALLIVGMLATGMVVKSNDTPPPETSSTGLLTSAQQQFLTQALKDLEKRKNQRHLLHVKLQAEITCTEQKTKQPITSSIPLRLEAWLEDEGQRHRAEFKPNVSLWTDGAAPFYWANETYLDDGKTAWWLTQHERPRKEGHSPKRLALYLGTDVEDKAEELLTRMKERGLAQAGQWLYEVEKTTWQGRSVLRVTETMDPKLFASTERNVTTALLDPAHDHAVVHFETENGLKISWTMDEMGTTPGGLAYPAKSTRHWQPGDPQTYRIQVSLFETLDGLPGSLFTLPPSDEEKYTSTDKSLPPAKSMGLHVVSAKDGVPLPGTELAVTLNGVKKVSLTADEKGIVFIPFGTDQVKRLVLRAKKDGFTKQVVSWEQRGNPLKLPGEFTLKLSPASRIFGKVITESGAPIADALIDIIDLGPDKALSIFSDHHDIWDATSRTKADGSWEMQGFPEDLTGLSIRVSHPDYIATTDSGTSDYRTLMRQDYTSLRDGSSVIKLKVGASLAGVVVDDKGQPVADCHLILGKDSNGTNLPQTTTKADGTFLLKGLQAQESWLTVESSRLRPLAMQVKVTPEPQEPLRLQLQPGRVLRARVVKEDGSPSAGLYLIADGWNHLRTLQFSTTTDAQGRFTWNHAPDEPVRFCFGVGQEREFLCGLPLSPAEEEQTVVMRPAIRLRGIVRDAQTHAPVKLFRVTPGRWWENSSPVWDQQAVKTFRNGAFEWQTTYMIENRYHLKIEAEGYEPLITDHYPTEQQTVELNLQLKPGR